MGCIDDRREIPPHGGPVGRDHRRATLGEEGSQRVQKRSAAVVQQSLGGTQAARFARRENEAGGVHFASAAALTDLESERQLDSALRRTAIISAVTEMAISSGEIAPISRPMGACRRSKAARGTPSFSSSRITPITLRLLPIMAM